MSHLSPVLRVRRAAGDPGRSASPRLAAVPGGDVDAPGSWTPARIDLARRLWGKGVDEADIVLAIHRLPGARTLDAEAVADLARRLRWPGPKQQRFGGMPATRDGAPSIAERLAAELAEALAFVELPLQDALAWGRANSVTRERDESDADLLRRINRARSGYSLPPFRITRHESALAPAAALAPVVARPGGRGARGN